MPLISHDRDEVFVGRIRRDESQPRTMNMWMVSDNLRKGAATNAVQIAEYIVEGKADLIKKIIVRIPGNVNFFYCFIKQFPQAVNILLFQGGNKDGRGIVSCHPAVF